MRYGSKFLMPLAFAALLSLGGCVADIETIETPGGDEPPVDGKVRIELLTPAADYATPATRAGKADEGAIGDSPWVLVFAGEGDDALSAHQQTPHYTTILPPLGEKMSLELQRFEY